MISEFLENTWMNEVEVGLILLHSFYCIEWRWSNPRFWRARDPFMGIRNSFHAPSFKISIIRSNLLLCFYGSLHSSSSFVLLNIIHEWGGHQSQRYLGIIFLEKWTFTFPRKSPTVCPYAFMEENVGWFWWSYV